MGKGREREEEGEMIKSIILFPFEAENTQISLKEFKARERK